MTRDQVLRGKDIIDDIEKYTAELSIWSKVTSGPYSIKVLVGHNKQDVESTDELLNDIKDLHIKYYEDKIKMLEEELANI